MALNLNSIENLLVKNPFGHRFNQITIDYFIHNSNKNYVQIADYIGKAMNTTLVMHAPH